ncbi:succinate dehydrogenase [ubiquinone] cytochrome b small subunit, mitochondrial isoform X1 [Hyposmocoma kahamanoa]|uniref:succinate dehydrogenase [ubiquinone] cytochrome b small subunit, mitochondrial isoform X1 n=1 Tax=Hyposmocoma kahamanoa TaxID=1477025 RepID=UPI000E6D9066|nr:succinate dehydrogenase [ubiquinone] cytochrome b small subunit, mitochondrial isoform X1 [Hyposmocoma kahamanoa]
MALSMFLRTPACASRLISQHVRRLALQPALAQRTLTNTLPASCISLKESKNTPTLNAVREFKTTPVHCAAEHAHDHSRLWVIERAVTAVMLGAIPAALIMPNKILDSVVAILITAHSFWGLEAVAVDYVRESIFGKIIPKIAIALVYLIHIATLGGLFYIISHDIGIANTIRQLWSIKSVKA